jgi:hypothetical protein
MNNEHEKTEN